MRDTGLDTPVEPSTAVLQVRGLTFSTGGARLLEGIDLNVQPGRRTVIMGPNGAGKSLLLRLLHGLIAPTSGEVLWQGRPLDKRARQAQAMVFQRPVMLRRSVVANIRFALKVRGIGRQDRVQREEQALARAGLLDAAGRPSRVLSGGEQQRLAVARALSCAPRMLLLDEPTASLDPAATNAVEDLIRDASADGVTVVLVTHDVGQAKRLGEDLIFMDGGRVVETGSLTETLAEPRSAPLRAWLEGRLYLDDKT
ncbi:MAG: ATP-binding cassette domain-containing protein [Pseudomonadota bacterium]